MSCPQNCYLTEAVETSREPRDKSDGQQREEESQGRASQAREGEQVVWCSYAGVRVNILKLVQAFLDLSKSGVSESFLGSV